MSRLLFVAASPGGWRPVNFAQEQAEIDNAIESSPYRSQLERQVRLHAGLGDICAVLERYQPHIVHFVGHGTESGQVVLAQLAEDEELLVTAQSMTSLFEPFASHVQLIVLNACHTADLAQKLAERVGCAIGMRGQVRNTEATAFAETFYRTIGSGASVRLAFDLAAASLGERSSVPVLHCAAGRAERLHFTSWLVSQRRHLPGMAALASTLLLALGLATTSWGSRPTPESVSPTRMVLIRGGSLLSGSERAQAEAAYARCLTEYKVEAQDQCADRFDRSVFYRELRNERAPVTVHEFLLDAHEVSNAQFAAWLTERRQQLTLISDPKRLAQLGLPGPVVSLADEWLVCVQVGRESSHRAITIRATDGGYEPVDALQAHPVRMLSWKAAAMYCSAQDKRLPSADEWEWAARGPEDRQYPWGESSPACDGVAFGRRPSGHCAQSPGQTASVASGTDVTPNGVFDLGGNLSEWVASSVTEAQPDLKQIRGGYYRDESVFLVGSRRFQGHRGGAYVQVGFRCAKDPG